MKIKIKNNKNEFLINVKVNADVKDLKRKIEAKCGIPTYRQKIIKKGKVLLDKNPLSFYEITPSDTLMLLGENPASGISKHLAHIKAIFSLEVDDIVTVIFSFLSIRDLQLCLRVSKTWRALAEQNTFAVDRYEILHSQVCFDLLIGKPIYLLESNSPFLIPYEVCSSSSTNNNNNSDSDAPTTMIEDDQQQQQQQENHDDNSDSDDSYDDVDSSSQMNKKKRVSSSSTAALVPPPFDCNLASVRASQYLFVHRRCDSTQLSSDVIECRELETGCLLWRKNVCSIISSIPELEQLVRLDELQDQFDQEREDLLLSYRRRRGGGGGLRRGAGGADDMPPPSRFTVQLFCDWKLQRLFVKVYDICLAAFNIADADLIAAMKNIGSSCGTPVPSPKMVAYYCGSNRLDYAASKREWRLVSSWMVDNVVLASIAITGGTEQDRYTIVALNKTQLRPVTSSVVDTAYYFVRDNGNMFFHVHDADYDHEILDSTSRAVTTGHWRIRSVAQFTKHHVLIGGSEVINLNCGGGHTVWGGNRRQSGESAFMLYENPETGDLDGVFTLSSGSSGSSTVQVQLLALMKEYKYKWVGREKKVIEEVAEVPCWKTEVRLDDNDHGGARSKYRSFARAGNLLLAAFLSKCGGSSKIIVCAIVVFGIHAGTVVWKTSVPLLLSVNKSPRCDGISIRERGKVVFVDSFEYISPATRKNSAVPEGCTCTAAVYAFKLSSGELLDKMLMCAPAGVVDPTSAAASISTEQ